jgi:cysteine desulfurase
VPGQDGHIITSSIEHHAVLHTARQLEKRGCSVTYLPVDGGGRVNPEDVRRAIRPDTALVSIMMANNETGVLQPLKEIGQITREHGVLFHTDAVQAAGKVRVDVELLGCDLLSLSGHKMHGPQGAGVLFVRRGIKLAPMFYGGSHELGYRPGTENVAGIVGLGAAAAIAAEELANGGLQRVAELRNELERSLLRAGQDAGVNGSRSARVPNTTNIWFGGLRGRSLLTKLDTLGLSVSGGSACTAGTSDSSHVLRAMGLSREKAHASIRFSLSKFTAAEDIDFAIWQVCEALELLRRRSSNAAVRA